MQVLDVGRNGDEQQKCPKPEALGVLPPFLGSPGEECFLRTELAFDASRACLIGLSFLQSSAVNEFPGPTEVEQSCIFLIKLSDY